MTCMVAESMDASKQETPAQPDLETLVKEIKGLKIRVEDERRKIFDATRKYPPFHLVP
jgi:hypothetical protein